MRQGRNRRKSRRWGGGGGGVGGGMLQHRQGHKQQHGASGKTARGAVYPEFRLDPPTQRGLDFDLGSHSRTCCIRV